MHCYRPQYLYPFICYRNIFRGKESGYPTLLTTITWKYQYANHRSQQLKWQRFKQIIRFALWTLLIWAFTIFRGEIYKNGIFLRHSFPEIMRTVERMRHCVMLIGRNGMPIFPKRFVIAAFHFQIIAHYTHTAHPLLDHHPFAPKGSSPPSASLGCKICVFLRGTF